jgi:formylglycine-generating enzyme required for sulfatase activity
VGDFLGTPDYMSPEQIRGGITKEGKGDIDGRSDLYSTGVMLYQLLTGSLPFPKMNKMALLGAHLHGTPMPMKEANPAAKVPPKVERLVMRCLENDPDLRPQTARELAEQFRKAIAGVLPEPEKPRRKPPLLPIAAVCVLVAGLIVAALWRPDWGVIKPSPPNGTNEVVVKPPPPPQPWAPEGYEPVGSGMAPGSDEAMRIRRKSDNVEFERLKAGVYLPVGYEPESGSLEDLTEGVWPRVIVRSSDKRVRFIRIPGKTYPRGDPKTSTGPLARQWVKVSGFYIQETEVTNAEIEEWFKDHREPADSRRAWREYYDQVCIGARPVEKAKRYPAAGISYLTARRFATDMNGRLPTEAQWELAAKSCNDDYQVPWGKELPKQREKLKVNFSDRAHDFDFGPVEVMKSEQDRTDQGVYDMAGNVQEICLDPYQPYPKTSRNTPLEDPYESGDPPPDPGKYVVRGGSYSTRQTKWAVFHRAAVTEQETAGYIGFRLVITCPPVRKSAE